MARKYISNGKIYLEDSERKVIVNGRILLETTAVAPVGGRISSLAYKGGLAGPSGLAGPGGGLAG